MIDNRTWCVYVHTNMKNGKKYIGITSQSVESRWLNGYGYSRRLRFGRAIEKYGWDNFTHEILLDNLSEADAKDMERTLIRELHTQDEDYGYNMTCGGDGVSGFHHTEESKSKMSICKSGERHPNYGKHLSDSTRDKIANRLVGNKNSAGVSRSPETKNKIARSKMKAVCMYLDGILQRSFDSAKSAEQSTGINRKNISLCCLGQRKRAGGYEWKFA